MKNQFKQIFTPDSSEVHFPKSPIIVGIALLYLATIFGQSSDSLSLRSIILYTIIMMIQLGIYLFYGKIFKNKFWIYFVTQGIITFCYAVIAPNGYEPLIIGLIPLFVIQSMIFYNDAFRVVVTAVYFYSIYFGTILVISGVNELIKSIPLLIIVTISIRAYSIIFFKQIKLRLQSQKVLKELELAYEKVEELTISNERQRMARELHDTLSQGLAGVIMQLEAVNAHLNNKNFTRAQEIVQKSMEHARKTLSDSRLVINDLRSSREEIDFNSSIENEVRAFRNVSNISITTDIRVESEISLNILRHIIYIVREGLNNIAKHAKAQNAVVRIIENNNEINIEIEDDGIGFNIKILDKLYGHYGILGITERVKAVKGQIKIRSDRESGTSINIIIPINKGVDEENE